jgi:hypothetical protein
VTSSDETENERRRKRPADDHATDSELRPKRIKKDPLKFRRWSLKTIYGISLDDYARLLARQGGVCAICQRPPAKERLCIDHCHATGKVRGLLCRACNFALGLLRDDANAVMAAAAYLRKASS